MADTDMNQSRQSVGAIFDAALELPIEQRAAFLERACAGDAALRQRVEALLRASACSCFFSCPTDPRAMKRALTHD
jgi:hypothetical protein